MKNQSHHHHHHHHLSFATDLAVELVNVALAALSILAIIYVVWILPGTTLEKLLAECLGLRY